MQRKIQVRVLWVSGSWLAVASDPKRLNWSERTLAMLRRKVRRDLTLLLGQTPDIDYVYLLPDHIRPAMDRLQILRRRQEEVAAVITPATRDALNALLNLGISHGDAAVILGRSPQRMSQIKAGTRT